MSVVSNVVKKRKKTESKPQSQLNKCLNEKRRREQENIYIEELAELISASTSDMSSLSVKPDKCAILQETVNQIRRIKQEPGQSDELQQSEVSSSKPTILANDIYGPLLLEALDGFLFVVNIDGKIEFVSENITSFLKYTQDEIVDKSIYNIIHTGDRAHFSSNLLPMMSLGNGCNWTSESNSGISKSRSFNCRFLIKPSDSQQENMDDNKQVSSRHAQFENMQISAVFFPFARDGNENNENESDGQNRLACVARRIPSNEKSPTSLGVEQFTTRIDVTGKITAVDISGVSALYSQYLSKELVGCKFQDICHLSDVHRINQHLKDTLQSSNNVSVAYKLRVGLDRYVSVQTKSKHFHFNQSTSDQEFIMSTHSIIKDSENTVLLPVEGSQKSEPSPNVSASSSIVTSPVTSVNGNSVMSAVSLPTSSYNSYTFSPSSTDLVLSDLVLDIFPNSNWGNLEQSTQSRDSSDGASSNFTDASQSTSVNRVAVRYNSNNNNNTQSSNSAFGQETVTCTNTSGSPNTSVRSLTPFGHSSSNYSPSTTPVTSDISTPPTKAEQTVHGASEISTVDMSHNIAKYESRMNVQSNQKLRNLLTQNLDDSNNRLSLKHNSKDEDVIVLSRTLHVSESRSPILRQTVSDSGNSQSSGPGDIILRELLSQDEDDVVTEVQQAGERKNDSRLSGLLLGTSTCRPEAERPKKGGDAMLRKLLNNTDDSERSYNKPEATIQHLLRRDINDRNQALQISRTTGTSDMPNIQEMETTVAKQSVQDSSLPVSGICNYADPGSSKRKPLEHSQSPSSVPKRQNVGSQHAHLAGQNPMLASMLAQTPRTPPSVPTSIANTIMTQLPQERLPKNLVEKLVHTPYSTASASSANSSTQVISHSSNRLLFSAATIQQDVVTSDTRGHVTHHPSITLQSGLTKTNYQQPQQGFLNKILNRTAAENTLLSRSLSAPANSNSMQQFPQNVSFTLQYPPNISDNQNVTARGLRSMLSEGNASDSNVVQANQSSDPVLSEILEQIYSLQEEMNVETVMEDEATNMLKLFDDVMDTSSTSSPVTSDSVTANRTQDMNAKIAISAIQKQLMSMEGTSAVSSNAASPNPLLVPTYSQAGRTGGQVVRKAIQVPLSPTSAAGFNMLQQYAVSTAAATVPVVTQPPAYSSTVAAGRVRVPLNSPAGIILSNSQQQQILNLAAAQRMGLPHYSGANYSQLRRSLIERKQKLYLQQQQKRLLEQQQKQQMMMQTQQPLDVITPGVSSFPENMNELLNNTVAPNVSLQRSANIADSQLSPRYNTNIVNQLPSPASQSSTPQLSPGQRGNPQSPYSPLSQQPFPSPTPPSTTYQQSRLSPHSLPSYPQGGPSHSPSPVPPAASRSPHLQLSPQQGSSTQQWNQRPPQSPLSSNNLQQQNPMLNAQLSQASFNNSQPKFTAQQRQQLTMRSLPSPGSIQNSRSSPYPAGQSDRSYSPLSPATVYQSTSQQPQAQQRVQRVVSGSAQLNSARSTSQGQSAVNSFIGSGEPLLSPQPLHSPNFNQSLQTTSAASYSSPPASTTSVTTFSFPQDGQFFTFDKQSLQVFASNASERLRTNNNAQVSSDFVRQELRAIVGARTQQQQSLQNIQAQMLRPPPNATVITTGANTINLHTLSRQTLEELGLSVELLPGDNSGTSQSYSPSLLSIAGGLESSSRGSAPSPRVEEAKPADQRKSLLQQLLSEPT